MAVTVSSYHAINFTNGKQLILPQFSQFQWEPNTDYDIFNKCVVSAVELDLKALNGTVNWTLSSYGLPVRTYDGQYPDAGWYDTDGNLWYIEETRVASGNGYQYYFNLHVGSYSVSYGGADTRYGGNNFYSHQCSLIWAWYDSGNNRIAFEANGATFAGATTIAIMGIDNYINAYQPSTLVTWDNYRTLATDRAFVDAYQWAEHFVDFGYLRVRTKTANNSGWGQVGLSIPFSVFPTAIENNVTPSPFDDDSNKQGGNSTTGGGGGKFDRTSDVISVPALPTLNATKAGFVTLFKPTLSDLINIAGYLWSSSILVILRDYFFNPMDIIIGLGIVPVSAPADSSDFPKAGVIEVPYSIPIYNSQYYEHDCGSVIVNEFWGSAFDYSPYTQIQLYLPYIGVRELNVDEVMGKTIGVKYHIDLFGGACVAYVTVNGSVRYQFSGECLQQIPVNASNYDQLVQNLVQVGCVVGSGIAAAGGSGITAAIDDNDGNISSGAIHEGLSSGAYSAARSSGAKEWISEHGRQLADCTVSAVMGSKPRIERTGSLAATSGQLGVQTPFLIISRAEQSLPNNYKHYRGYPSNITSKLSDLSGYTEVESIRINDLAATQGELVEIYELLKKGVII